MGIGIFSDPKYNAPSQNALNFIKNQMANDLPRSYRIPATNPTDPWANQSNRSNIYDIGMALLVFTTSGKTSGDYSYCQTIMNRLNNSSFPKSGGGFYFN